MITSKEISIAKKCISHAISNGASAARVYLNKCVTDSCTILNSELDKVTHSADRSIYIYLFVDGRYGTFSTNRFDDKELEDFVCKAISMVRMLGEDLCRKLPDIGRTAKDAVTGRELGLFDASCLNMDAQTRLENAHRMSIYKTIAAEDESRGYRLISEECEYSCTAEDNYTIDSQGFEGRHSETAFGTFSEMTIEDKDGNKYSGYWWNTSQKASDTDLEECSKKALERAVSQIGPEKRRSGTYRMVVDNTVSSRLVSPLLTALNAASIQQKMSFLEDSLGRKIFHEGLTLSDLPRTYGKNGSRLFDTEGVATKDAVVIENGVVKQYFVNTYMSEKMGIPPTIEDISRPCMKAYMKGKDLQSEEKEVSLKDILLACSNGILVTGFNGGNCNPVTGDFSFGIEGYAFRNGKISHPVREMLITGNIVALWNKLVAVGSDARNCSRWQIPSLAFEDVVFSA
ncbi:MAG: TldD/PmbA family protein [Bacteroidales bacterium]|nr:TldD/PmbA family protein [Bacteroidales bacterium]